MIDDKFSVPRASDPEAQEGEKVTFGGCVDGNYVPLAFGSNGETRVLDQVPESTGDSYTITSISSGVFIMADDDDSLIEAMARAHYAKRPTWRKGENRLVSLEWHELELWQREWEIEAMQAALAAQRAFKREQATQP